MQRPSLGEAIIVQAERLHGKVWVVTGANRGLGKALSTELAKLGAHVIMLCRDESRGQAALEEVKRASGSTNVSMVRCDVSLPESVRSSEAGLYHEYSAIHGLVHCAAVFTKQRSVTKDGVETMLATNVLRRYLLTRRVLNDAQRTEPTRVILVSAPSSSVIDFDDLQGATEWKALHQFGVSVACSLVLTFAMARKVDKSQATFIAVHPGLMKSDLMREAPAFIRGFLRLVSKKPEVAARKIAALASSKEMAGVTGVFYKGTKPAKAVDFAYDAAVQDRLWKESAALVGIQE